MSQQTYSTFVDDLAKSVEHIPFWEAYIRTMLDEKAMPFALHLGVFVEPYLHFILDGEKTIESRFSVHRMAPFEKVQRGDVVLLKRSGGPIVGICQVADAWFYRLDPDSWSEIQSQYARAICAQSPEFWEQRAHTSYATLMRIQRVSPIPPLQVRKRDRRGWIVLISREDNQTELS